ncbi:alpha/beta hydrolase [Noviherbaspirillum sp. Root189]|nr:alpha/beta hydrolase [Noviherbaspirillum sp. Root189]
MEELIGCIQSAIDAARLDPEFIQASAALPCTIRLAVGRDRDAVMLDLVGSKSSSLLLLSAEPETWSCFTNARPPVGFHSFTAAVRDPNRLKVQGEGLQVAQSLHALERFFEILRGQIVEKTPVPSVPAIECITGHYARLDAGSNNSLPVYYERAGNRNNPPLVMLHTAGADSRQYHHILSDPDMLAMWDMYAFDMPAHGKTMPASGSLWQSYRLDKQTYSFISHAFITSVVKSPAVILGCSMGAAMALYLGKLHPADIAGIVALEAPYQAKGRKTPHLEHPQINQAAHNPSYVRGLMSPTSPLHQRRAAAWVYSQGGFQVYSGDLAFYSEEFDAEVDLKGLDATSKPVYLLTGAYDYSATPADSKRVAELIPGAHFIEMPDLGHFPMIENPDALLAYLKPVMRQLRSRMQQ